MTDYRSRLISGRARSGSGSWKAIVFVFLSIVIFIAVANGISKMGEAKQDNKTGWDGSSPFTFFIHGDSDYLAVFQKDPKRFVAVKIDGLVDSNLSGGDLVGDVSARVGVVVKKHVSIGTGKSFDGELQDFSSVFTPVKIVFGGTDNLDTNISRYEAIRLWWQFKGIRSENAEIIDSEPFLGGNESRAVLGVSSSQINRIIRNYTENEKILSDNLDIKIVNRSGEGASAALLETFISSSGGSVVEVVGTVDSIPGCNVEGADSYTRDYLAKTFDCDITDSAFENISEGNLTITIGQEFADTYF